MIKIFKLTKLIVFLASIGFILLLQSCAETEIEKINREFKEFITDYENKVIPLQEKYKLADYNAAITGNIEEYNTATELKIMISKIYSNKENFNQLKRFKESNLITEELLVQQLNILYNLYLPNQIDEKLLSELITLDNEIKHKFSTYRPVINEKDVSVEDIESVLRTSNKTEELKKYWEASKEVGKLVSDDLIKIVKMRNKAAKALGFKNYYEMELIINGQSPEEIDNIFDELDILTRGPYIELKDEIDQYLAKKFKISVEELKPWHYQNRFFQKAPLIYDTDFDKYYKNKDFIKLVKTYFKGIGLDISDVLDKSDFSNKPGKQELAFTTDIDRKGDIRISGHIKNNMTIMTTLLYEAGFSSYLKYIDNDLPYLLHQPPQFTANDAVATLFSGFSINPGWLEKVVGISKAEKDKIIEISFKQLRLEKFVFSRFAQVMYRFEKEFYEDPDQDLNLLWWQLVSNFQMLNKPADRNEPDWATKTHITTMPCSYHNYLLGELIASQIHTYINEEILDNDGSCETKCIDNPKVGEFMIEKLFKTGAKYNMQDWIKNATGDKLSPDYFTKQYIKFQ
ncbi:MAG: M2 family metallopeptidase [Bacteroidales bacterium]|nr:M2 family metallopeptidase [Bacteroidales bacterium]